MRAPLLCCALVALTCLHLPARADGISGIAWSVPASTADNVPTLGNTPGPNATEVATFTASSITFSGDKLYTLGGFLNSFGAANNINYMNTGSAGFSLDNILFEFTGTATFVSGQTFNVYHDDGVNLYVNGVNVLSQPQATSPITTPYTYTGPSGTYNFDFIYANGPCCMADFQTNLVLPTTVVGATPEPSALLLFGTGASALVALRRRFSLSR